MHRKCQFMSHSSRPFLTYPTVSGQHGCEKWIFLIWSRRFCVILLTSFLPINSLHLALSPGYMLYAVAQLQFSILCKTKWFILVSLYTVCQYILNLKSSLWLRERRGGYPWRAGIAPEWEHHTNAPYIAWKINHRQITIISAMEQSAVEAATPTRSAWYSVHLFIINSFAWENNLKNRF